LTPDAAITVPATELRPQAHVRRGSPTAQKNGRFKSVVISLCRFVDAAKCQTSDQAATPGAALAAFYDCVRARAKDPGQRELA